jgi:hypothetical protein
VTISNPTEIPHGVEWRSAIKPSCEEGTGKVPVGTTRRRPGLSGAGSARSPSPVPTSSTAPSMVPQ